MGVPGSGRDLSASIEAYVERSLLPDPSGHPFLDLLSADLGHHPCLVVPVQSFGKQRCGIGYLREKRHQESGLLPAGLRFGLFARKCLETGALLKCKPPLTFGTNSEIFPRP